jgi:hypothetical protein
MPANHFNLHTKMSSCITIDILKKLVIIVLFIQLYKF